MDGVVALRVDKLVSVEVVVAKPVDVLVISVVTKPVLVEATVAERPVLVKKNVVKPVLVETSELVNMAVVV